MPKIRLIRWADIDVQFDFDLDNNNDDEWACAPMRILLLVVLRLPHHGP